MFPTCVGVFCHTLKVIVDSHPEPSFATSLDRLRILVAGRLPSSMEEVGSLCSLAPFWSGKATDPVACQDIQRWMLDSLSASKAGIILTHHPTLTRLGCCGVAGGVDQRLSGAQGGLDCAEAHAHGANRECGEDDGASDRRRGLNLSHSLAHKCRSRAHPQPGGR